MPKIVKELYVFYTSIFVIYNTSTVICLYKTLYLVETNKPGEYSPNDSKVTTYFYVMDQASYCN